MTNSAINLLVSFSFQNGAIIKFGRMHTFRFIDPSSDDRMRQRQESSSSSSRQIDYSYDRYTLRSLLPIFYFSIFNCHANTLTLNRSSIALHCKYKYSGGKNKLLLLYVYSSLSSSIFAFYYSVHLHCKYILSINYDLLSRAEHLTREHTLLGLSSK